MNTLVRRTHTCGALRASDVGQEVVLHGWVDSCRDHHHFVFVDLRDRWGITQVYFGEEEQALMAAAAKVKPEFVLAVRGTVRARPDNMINEERPTGHVEVLATGLEVLNDCRTPPFPISEMQKPSEEMRLRYRYLDLRRPSMQRNLLFRHRFFSAVRRSLDAKEFVDVETPMLTRAMPEGARDYVVPSRVNPGNFYALPQSPQLFKQILMVSGYDRYYQIARCLRDEDLRADRQPEFTQLDMEMSFVNEDDVFEVVETAIVEAVKATTGKEVPRPFPRISHSQSMLEFGGEKPDLRNSLRILDVSEEARGSGFKVFSGAVAGGGVVRVLRVPGGAELSRREIEKELEVRAKEMGAKGLAWTKITDAGEAEGGIGRFLGDDAGQAILARIGPQAGDALFFGADRLGVVCASLSEVMRMLGERFGGVDPQGLAFCWVVDFPLFEYSEEDAQWYPAQHAFTTPREDYEGHLEKDPGTVKARAYDLVMNGWELGSGGVRIHRRDLQQRVFDVLGISAEEARTRFGFLMEAFEFGAPPHGGIGIGLDRLVALLLGEDNIREVIPFPKTATAACLMTGAPSPIEDTQLEELCIELNLPEEDEAPEERDDV